MKPTGQWRRHHCPLPLDARRAAATLPPHLHAPVSHMPPYNEAPCVAAAPGLGPAPAGYSACACAPERLRPGTAVEVIQKCIEDERELAFVSALERWWEPQTHPERGRFASKPWEMLLPLCEHRRQDGLQRDAAIGTRCSIALYPVSSSWRTSTWQRLPRIVSRWRSPPPSGSRCRHSAVWRTLMPRSR